MALVEIPFKYKRNEFRDPVNKKIALRIDATVSLGYRRTATLSKYPIEDGSEITDHYTLDPKVLSVQGVISNTPIEIFDGALNVATGIIPSATGRILAGAAVSAGQLLIRKRTGPRSKPAKRAYNYLNELMTKKIPFVFVTKYERYVNMLLTSLDISRDTSTGDSLPFSCEMQEVKIVSAKRGDISVLDGINGKSASKFDLGSKSSSGSRLTADERTPLLATLNAFGVLTSAP